MATSEALSHSGPARCADDGVGRDIARDDGPRPNDSAISDGNAGQNSRSMPISIMADRELV